MTSNSCVLGVSAASLKLAFTHQHLAFIMQQIMKSWLLQALVLFGNGALHLDRLQFGQMVHGLCGAVGTAPEAMLDLLIILAAVDDRPADEMALLVLIFCKLQCTFTDRTHNEFCSFCLAL